ncbi:MAG: SLC13 family permease [Hespellia sp.]|nr:SLC13 family permease [Hespellia sp.]
MNGKKRLIYLLIGPAIYALITLLLRDSFTLPGAQAVGILLWMIFWWITRPVDMTVTALLPIAVNAVFHVIDMGTVTSQYFSDSIILIFGSCLLTIPWQSTGLDRRVALRILSVIGPTMRSQITVWLLASIVFSTMLPNVAVCALFTPIAVAMLHAAGYEDMKTCKPAVPILLAIGWGVGLGGVGSPLGGAMNVAAISFIEEYTGHEFMYIDWVIRMLPFFVIAAAVSLAYMLFISKHSEPINGTKEYFEKSYSELGPMKHDEKICAALFILALIGAFTRPLFANVLPALAPAYIFLILGCASFIMTAANKGPLMTWEYAQQNTMWGMMLLFGGGLALGKMVNESGASAEIAKVVSSMNLNGGFLTIVIFVVFAVLISEATNSTVSAAVTVPIVLSFTAKLGLNAIPYWFITIMAYNAEFLLPISVRAIPVAYGLDANIMMKKGIPLVLIRMAAVIIVGCALMKFWPAFSNIPYLTM